MDTAGQAVKQSLYNAYIKFDSGKDLGGTLGCIHSTDGNNRCDGQPCVNTVNCEHCCNYNTSLCYDCGGTSLEWLWWTLGVLSLFVCVLLIMVGIKRRKKQAELAAALAAHHTQGAGALTYD